MHSLQETRRYKVVSIDNFHNSYPRAFSRLEELARSALPPDASETEKESAAIDAYRCDLTNPADVRAIFEKYGKGGIWGVVHLAVRFHPTLCPAEEKIHSSGAKQAYKAVGESSEIPVTYYHNNVTATIYLLQIMSEFDCTRLVYSSSATVYGTPPVVPIPETTRLKADSPYGQSKIMCESVIQDLTQGMHFFLCHVRGGWLTWHSGTTVGRYLPKVLQPGRRAPIRSDRRGPAWETR